MNHSISLRSFATILGLALVTALPVAAQELTADEVSCQQHSSFVMASLVRRSAKCALKCAKATGAALADERCTQTGACALGADNLTCRCYTRAAASAVRTESRRCPDCPECYVNIGGDPNPECTSDAETKADTVDSFIESLLLTGAPAVFCDDSASLDGHTLAESKCELAAAKALGTFAKQKAVCLADCREGERDGSVPAGGCTPPIATNPNAPLVTKACVARWEGKTIEQIQKHCDPAAGGARPECWGARDGSAWAAVVEDFVDGEDATYFCAE